MNTHPPSITVPIVLSTGKRIDTTFALHYRVVTDDLDRLTPAERMEYRRLRTHVLDSNLTIHSNL